MSLTPEDRDYLLDKLQELASKQGIVILGKRVVYCSEDDATYLQGYGYRVKSFSVRISAEKKVKRSWINKIAKQFANYLAKAL